MRENRESFEIFEFQHGIFKFNSLFNRNVLKLAMYYIYGIGHFSKHNAIVNVDFQNHVG